MKLLTITDNGRAALRAAGYETLPAGKGGPEHEYWKHRIAEALRNAGYQVEIEKALENGQQTDIVASKDGSWIAVEVETGASDAAINIRKNLEAGAQQVICAGTSRKALEKLKQLVSDESWDHNVRLRLVLAGQWCDELQGMDSACAV